MSIKEGLGAKILAAGMAGARDKPHILGHGGIRRFTLHCSSGIKRRPSPDGNAAIDGVDVAAECAFICFRLLFMGIDVVAQHLLCQRHIDLAFVFVQKLFPPDAARIRRTCQVFGIKLRRVQFQDFRIPRPV